jgi:hypothetical protein
MKKPKKPQNYVREELLDIEDLSLADIIKIAKEKGFNHENSFVRITDYSYYDVALCCSKKAFTEEEFAGQIAEYNKQLNLYDKWLKENNGAIEKAKKEKKEKAIQNKLAKLEKQKQELEKEIQKLK